MDEASNTTVVSKNTNRHMICPILSTCRRGMVIRLANLAANRAVKSESDCSRRRTGIRLDIPGNDSVMRTEPAPSSADTRAARFTSADNTHASRLSTTCGRTPDNEALPDAVGSAVRFGHRLETGKFAKVPLPCVTAGTELHR